MRCSDNIAEFGVLRWLLMRREGRQHFGECVNDYKELGVLWMGPETLNKLCCVRYSLSGEKSYPSVLLSIFPPLPRSRVEWLASVFPSLKRLWQEDFYKLQGSMDCIGSFKPARATCKPVPQNKERKLKGWGESYLSSNS